MGRVKHVKADALSGADREIYERSAGYGSFASLLGAMANRPPIMRHTFEMLLELADEEVLPKRYLELALVTVSALNECTYCVSHHAPRLAETGVSEEAARDVLAPGRWAELDEVDRLVIEYARLVTERAGRVADEVFERLRRHFSDPQITELTWRTALCGAFNRFNDVLQNEIEPDVEVIDAVRRGSA